MTNHGCLCPVDFTWQAQVVTCVQARSAHKLCCISSVIRGVLRLHLTSGHAHVSPEQQELSGKECREPFTGPWRGSAAHIKGAGTVLCFPVCTPPQSLFFSCISLKIYSSYLIVCWGVWGRGRQTLNRPWIYSDTRAIGVKIMESKSFSCTCPKVGIQMSPLCCLKEHLLPLVCAGFFKKIIFVAAYKPCLK